MSGRSRDRASPCRKKLSDALRPIHGRLATAYRWLMSSVVHLSSEPPPTPAEADFAIYIDFARGEGNPSRVFQAADAMIRAFQKLDHALVDSIDASIQPTMVLEDIEAGSLKVWLRNVLTSVDDAALKEMDWKQQVGKYLVRAKYAYIDWSNKSGSDGSLIGLARQLGNIAAETDVRHMPDYALPAPSELVAVTKQVEEAKSFLLPSDAMSYLPGPAMPEASPLSFDLAIKWDLPKLLALSVKESTRFENMPMNLIVKRPDYLGASMWEFRHGNVSIAARVEDLDWLKKFQSRMVDVRPGDALKCLVTIDSDYGFDNELLEQKHTVIRVIDVLQNQDSPRSPLGRATRQLEQPPTLTAVRNTRPITRRVTHALHPPGR